MFYQSNQVEQQGLPQNQLRVDIDLRSKGQSEEPEWMDEPVPKQRSRRQSSLKLEPEIVKPPNLTLNMLYEQLQGSKKKLRKGVTEMIKQEIEHLEHKVFASETNVNQQEYLQSIYEHTGQNKYVRDEIYDTLHVAHHQIQNDIKKKGAPALQHRKIPRNKDQLRQMEQRDHYEMLKKKQGNVRQKVTSLREEIDQEYIKKRLKNRVQEMGGSVDPQYYSIEHPKTKEAEYFVKDIQQRRKEEHNQYEMMMSARRERQEYEKEKQAEMKEIQRMERRTRLKQYYESKLHQKLQQKQHQREKQQQFKEWIKAYQRERPVQVQREQQYRMKVLIPELEQRHKKLMTIKAEHKPIDTEELAQHEMKYLQFKKDDSIRKRAEMELADEEDQMRKDQVDQRFYKGKYRLMVLEQMLEEKYPLSAKDLEQSKKDRIKAYDSIVRRSLKSHPERSAGQTLEAQSMSHQKFIRRVRNINGSLTITNHGQHPEPQQEVEESLPPIESASDKPNRYKSQDIDSYKQGIKNLHYMKNKVRESLAREQENRPKIKLVEEKEEVIKPKNYLEIQREKRLQKKQKPQSSTKKQREMHSTDVTGNEQIQAIKSKAEYLDEKLQRHEMKLKNVHNDEFEGRAQMQGEYVQAIKKKLEILGQFD